MQAFGMQRLLIVVIATMLEKRSSCLGNVTFVFPVLKSTAIVSIAVGVVHLFQDPKTMKMIVLHLDAVNAKAVLEMLVIKMISKIQKSRVPGMQRKR